MPVPFSLADAVDLVDISIQDIYLKGSEMKETFYDRFMNIETGVTDYYMKDSSITGLGYAGRIAENAVVTSAAPVQGFKKTYTQVEFGLLLPITKRMWYFGIKKRSLERVTNEVRKAVEDKREQLCVDRLDQSYNTSYSVADVSGNWTATTTGGDGLAFISASHTREDGGTVWNNRVTDGTTVNMDWEYDALKAAFRTAALIPDPNGKPTNINLDTFVCSRGYATHHRALEMLAAMGKGFMPGTADRDGSAVPTFKIIAIPWVQTNNLYWWMFDSSYKNATYGLQYKESQAMNLEGPNVVFKTGEIQYKVTVMFDIGHNDPRGWVGSKNTNAA